MKRLFYVCCSLFVFAACKKEDKYLPPNFNYEIPQVAISQNVNVGAYFSNYSSADWAKKYSDTPTLGQYSALDAATMAQERTWADQGGIDFFVFNWNNAAADNQLISSFSSGRTQNVRMVLNYNTAHLGATNASPLTGTKLNTMISEFKSFAANHFNQDYYYSVDGKPVVLITPLNLASGAASSIDFATVIPALRKAMDSLGVKLYLIGEITSGWLPPVRYAPAVKVMDGVSMSDWSTNVYDRAVMMPSFTDLNWKNWTDSTTSWNMDFVPCIFPGFNDKAMSPASKLYNIDRTSRFFTDMTNVAKRNMGSKRLVLINSWNDFQKGTSLEPAKSYGSSYLDISRQLFKIK